MGLQSNQIIPHDDIKTYVQGDIVTRLHHGTCPLCGNPVVWIQDNDRSWRWNADCTSGLQLCRNTRLTSTDSGLHWEHR